MFNNVSTEGSSIGGGDTVGVTDGKGETETDGRGDTDTDGKGDTDTEGRGDKETDGSGDTDTEVERDGRGESVNVIVGRGVSVGRTICASGPIT
jgi:hypothetical protein